MIINQDTNSVDVKEKMILIINEMCKSNFDENNIKDINKQIEQDCDSKVLRMINASSSSSKVNITDSSRKSCAKSLFR